MVQIHFRKTCRQEQDDTFMMDYDNDGQLTVVGQSCRKFTSGKPDGRKYNRAAGEDISCSGCSHWNGEACIKNSFDNVLTRLDSEG